VTSQEKCSVVAGLVAWLLGLLMWATSLSFVRRRFYDVFFSVHHLYLLFTLFWLYHAVWNYFFFVIPVLLFFVDRFLRMLQSASLVHVSSAKLLESGAIELNLPLPHHHTGSSARITRSALIYISDRLHPCLIDP
jgi:signal transduction histidine kinase